MRRFDILAVAATATVFACGGNAGGGAPVVGPTSVDHVAMSVPTATVQVGDQLTLTATGVAADGTPVAGSIVWSTVSAAIATVAQNGVVTGVAPGLVNINASIGGQIGHTAVTVIAKGAAVPGDYTDVTIAPSLWTTCGHTAVDGVRCWGMNPDGQLGDGTTTDHSSPVQVSIALAFTQVESGNAETCGRTPRTDVSSGDVYCWGNLHFGAGSTDRSPTPRIVSGGKSFVDISIGEVSACGTALGGAPYCWGSNQYGAIGDGTRSDRTAPVAISGGLLLDQVVVGSDFACGRRTGNVYCWGRNQLGQLGDGTTTDRLVPTRVAGIQLFETISASMTYVCGLTLGGGKIYCWGNNFGVVQGTGSGGQSTVPVVVNSTQQFARIAAGVFHACALTAEGAAWCWGENDHRELGDGSTASTRTTPVAVTGGLAFTRIAAGHWYTCGVSTIGAMYCWGYNGYGNLGDGTLTNRTAPTLVK